MKLTLARTVKTMENLQPDTLLAPPKRAKVVLHCDLDSFFASVEQAARPELYDKPVAVSAARGQSVITAASYEAKRLGVKVGVPLRTARQLCPDLVFVPARMEAYQRCGNFVQDIIRSTGARIETLGLDECFLMLDHVLEDNLGTLPEGLTMLPADPYDRARVVGTWIRSTVFERTGLRISVGGGSNKTVAKLATDSGKPDGLLILRPFEELSFLHRQPFGPIAGIGPSSIAKLHSAGITTVGEVSHVSQQSLIALLGKRQGRVVHAISHNLFDEGVTPNPKPKSTSATRSFGANGHNALQALEDLLGEVLQRIAQSGRSARCVGVFAADSTTIYQAKHDLGASTANIKELAATARSLMVKVPSSFHANFAGVTLDGLSDNEQLRLGFDTGWLRDPEFVAPVLQRVHDPAKQLQRSAYKGMLVNHPDFGPGMVESLQTHTLTICFADRRRVLEYWTLLDY